MSEIHCKMFSLREEERLLKKVLGCAVPEFVARFGTADAVKRIESELRRARRARSRKFYTFWRAVLAQIDGPSKESPARQRAKERGPFDPLETFRFHEDPQQWRRQSSARP